MVFVISNGEVHQRAELFASDNPPVPAALSIPIPLDELLPRRAYAAPLAQGPAPIPGYALAVEYRPCPTLSAGSPNFTFDSDPAMAAEVGGTRQANATDFVPDWTCAPRVFARVTHAPMFSSAIGNWSMTETSRGTVRIFPTEAPTEVSNVWPVTRRVCNRIDYDGTNQDAGEDLNDVKGAGSDAPDQCDDDDLDTRDVQGSPTPDDIIDLPCVQDLSPPIEPCTFWDSGSVPNGAWKHTVDFSRCSDLAKRDALKTRANMFVGWANDCDEVAPDCRDYITNYFEGNSPDRCGISGTNSPLNDYSTVTVFVWRWGEQDTAWPANHSIATNNEGALWGYYQSNRSALGIENTPTNRLKRVIAARAARLRFCRGYVQSPASELRGYFVGWTNFNAAPVGPTEPCAPSLAANTVATTE